MKLKKVCGLLMGTVMMASMLLTGCGGPKDASGESNSQEGSGQEQSAEGEGGETSDDGAGSSEGGSANKIIVFQSKVEITDQLEALAEDYQEETGVEVEVWGTTGDDYFQQLKNRLANNQGPTVFSLAPGTESEQMKSYLEDLSDLSFVGQLAEGMANEMDGKVMGIP